MSEQFLFDDFFVAQDASDEGELIEVEINDRLVPVYIKRGLSFEDKAAAKAVGVKQRVKPNGEVEIVSMDEAAFAVELLYRCIVSWPFVYSSGRKVPVSRENIRLMLSEGAEAVAQVLLQRINKKREAKQPFTTPSE
ncbi:hypothetical protein [Ktedonospora formicarum]|uniref:Tail assembly chaperone n=1 Tax=Ktedonospora formicarum TaxID=2778364 RepID=A0A8J3MT22_9CHLR|nr:hypothetical protein [Ktedonospora formicarum]GHO45193.1 hypothetical protein KSX_33560 [Ktedonospora formicarum]